MNDEKKVGRVGFVLVGTFIALALLVFIFLPTSATVIGIMKTLFLLAIVSGLGFAAASILSQKG